MNVLLIMPSFFDYHNKIVSCIREKGNFVKLYDDNLPYTLFERIFKKVFKRNFKIKFDKYINRIINENKDICYDKVILIFGGNRFDYKNVLKLKKSFKKAEFVYYAWDSVKNFPNILDFYSLFDIKYSFDTDDCNSYGMTFLPLFYTGDYCKCDMKYDYSLVMSFYVKKAKNYNLLCSAIPLELSYKKVLYLKHVSSYFVNKILHPILYKNYKKSDFAYKSISKNESDMIINQSKVVVDCPLENQNGLTIRVFEALKKKKKIVTTNKNISMYDFYCEDNIFIVENNKKVPIEFFNSKFNNDYCISTNYSLETFVEKLIGEKENSL